MPEVSVPPLRRRIMSGIQPTGMLHLGNQLGAINSWCELQNEIRQLQQQQRALGPTAPEPHKMLISIVDLHALTVRRKPADLRRDTHSMAAQLLACGLSSDCTSLFVQSHVPQHAELQWLLGCQMPMAWLNQMTTYKDKVKQLTGEDLSASDQSASQSDASGKSSSTTQIVSNDGVSFGLFAYPLLQAADVLLYGATHVPVGEDQYQHLELCRRICDTVNSRHGAQTLTRPVVIKSRFPRVMSLRDAHSKMSKSAVSDASRININDTNEAIQKKVARAVTDSIQTIQFDELNRPEIANLLRIASSLANQPIEEIVSGIGGTHKQLKDQVAELLCAHISPIRGEYERLVKDKAYLDSVLAQGRLEATSLAEQTMIKFRRAVGLLQYK